MRWHMLGYRLVDSQCTDPSTTKLDIVSLPQPLGYKNLGLGLGLTLQGRWPSFRALTVGQENLRQANQPPWI